MSSEKELVAVRDAEDKHESRSLDLSPQRYRSVWRLFSFIILTLPIMTGILACRELTTPTQPDPDMILAQAQVFDANEKPAVGVYVKIHPSSEELASTFSAELVTGDDGKFAVWVPNLPLSVSFRPVSGSTFPNEDREKVLFFKNELRKFVLRGEYHVGIIGPERYADSLKVARLIMSTYVERIGGGQDGLLASTSIEGGGGFEIFLPQAGRFSASLQRCCDFYVDYDWPDSIQIASGDTIRLELPLVSHQVRFTLGGDPVPSGALSLGTTFPGSGKDKVRTRIYLDGQGEVFEIAGLSGATRIEADPYLSTALLGSPIISGIPGVLSFAPIAISIPPLNDGDLFSVELGQYELQVQVLDPQGEPFPLVDVELTSESWSNESVDLNTNDEGRAIFRVNPTGHGLRIFKSGYLDARRYFTVTGDMQMTVTLQPIPAKN